MAVALGGCAGVSATTIRPVARCFVPLDPKVQAMLGVDCSVFEIGIPEGHSVTVWCEYYRDGQLDEKLSRYVFLRNPMDRNPFYEKIAAVLVRRDPDFVTGKRTLGAVWSFGFFQEDLIQAGEYVARDPFKVSKGYSVRNAAEDDGGVLLVADRPCLLYCMVGDETSTGPWREDKSDRIRANDHVLCVYARLDKRREETRAVSGGGLITGSDHPLVLGKGLELR